MISTFGRRITYLRLSVTDRCNLRCGYCMPHGMRFLPHPDVLSLEELERICVGFMRKGVRKIRLTGGEPLVRRNLIELVDALGRRVADGDLDELTLTTNGTLLARYAQSLADAGIRRVNVSLDSLDPVRFEAITRGGHLGTVLDGIWAAKAAGLTVKINTVALKGENEHEFDGLIAWCGLHGFDLSLIEVMPLGGIPSHRQDHYLSLEDVRQRLEKTWTLTDSSWRSGGPARYADIAETGCRLGFITPATHNFCDSCNRMRVTSTGKLYPCLGVDHSIDLRDAIRSRANDTALEAAIDRALALKPERHSFWTAGPSGPAYRSMSVTGG